jgi:hypothetical protein
MPDAVIVFQKAKLLFAPGKANGKGNFRIRNVSKLIAIELTLLKRLMKN